MAGPNPWGAKGLEWQTPSPPPTENFEETPVVTEEAYAYAPRTESTVAEVALASLTRPALAHQFEDIDQQHEAGNLGMWVFLATEIMFFGGLFAAYTVYRYAVSARVRGREPSAGRQVRRDQHSGADLQQLDHGAGGSRRADGKRKALMIFS